MAVDELSRNRLAQRAVEVFGEAEAATLMDHLPVGGVSNLATKDDLALTRAELRADFAELRGELGKLRADIEERLNRQTITLITTMTGVFGLMLAIFKWA
jgi:hypothetical protein